jgi:hypothetical protein
MFPQKSKQKTLGCALCYQGSAKAWPVVAAKVKAEFKGKRFFCFGLSYDIT